MGDEKQFERRQLLRFARVKQEHGPAAHSAARRENGQLMSWSRETKVSVASRVFEVPLEDLEKYTQQRTGGTPKLQVHPLIKSAQMRRRSCAVLYYRYIISCSKVE
jgi:hypothetical protein